MEEEEGNNGMRKEGRTDQRRGKNRWEEERIVREEERKGRRKSIV